MTEPSLFSIRINSLNRDHEAGQRQKEFRADNDTTNGGGAAVD
jgi:hypothetical protein